MTKCGSKGLGIHNAERTGPAQLLPESLALLFPLAIGRKVCLAMSGAERLHNDRLC